MRLSLAGLMWMITSGVHAQPIIAGWIERVGLMEAGIEVHAKLDSGADHSSLHATDLFEFERDGRRWVRFSLRNREDVQVEIERPVVRVARIKRRVDIEPGSGRASDASPARRRGNTRPVIELTLCVGRLAHRVEVNLTDRGRFQYQLLIGRSFLGKGVLVDSSSTYLTPPSCEVPAHE